MRTANKSILFKTKYLYEEYKEVKEKFDDYCVDFFKEVNKSQNLNPPQSPEETASEIVKAGKIEESDQPSEESEEKAVEDSDLRDGLKKLYKRIVLITHPDRHPEYLSEDKKKEMIDIYNRSTNAIKENDLFSLLDAASELYLDLPKLERKELKNIKKKCLEFEKNINDIKNTYQWVWGGELDSSRKEHIVKAYIDSRHKD
jgi:hypothetical protein